jgi:hypothetical protein
MRSCSGSGTVDPLVILRRLLMTKMSDRIRLGILLQLLLFLDGRLDKDLDPWTSG